MSNILKRNETGYGILIEHDAGYVDFDTNTNILNNILNENFELKLDEPILVDCILQKWGVKNKNGRIYPKDVLIPQVNDYQKLIDNNSAVSEADHPECVLASESTIYTKDGWKNFENISENEEILTLNPATNKIETQKIDKKIYLDYKGEMYKFSGKNIDLTVTGNHRFLLENSKGERDYYLAEDIYNNKNGIFSSGKYKLLKLGEWEGKYNEFFILNGVNKNTLSFNLKHDLIDKYTIPLKIKSEDWFAFLGIYLADGHSSGTKSNQYKLKGYDVVITQKKEKSKREIEDLLNKLPFKYWISKHETGKYQYHIADARLYDYLFPLGHSHNKYIPNEIKQASSDHLKIFFKWFQMGDGRNVKSIHENWSNKESVFSTSKHLIEDLHEILIKIGGNGNITTYQPPDRILNDEVVLKKEHMLSDGSVEQIKEVVVTKRLVKAENSKLQYNLNISKTKNIYLDKRSIKIKKISVDDNIACVRVKNGNFMVKVNGKSHWTGNSSIISLQNISHLLTKMWWGKGDKENILYGRLKLIVSPGFIKYGIVSVVGDKILLYLQNKIQLGISSRGVGTLKEENGENMVQNDFELIGFDLVATPSTPGAYLFPPNSSKENFTENIMKKETIDDNLTNALNNFLL